MKRFLLIFICITLLGGLCLPSLGASEAAASRTLYVRGALSWEAVYLWTGGETGEIFGPMPGTKMFRDGEIHRLCIPNDLTTFTLSSKTASIGSITAEPDQDLYVTVDANGTARVEYGGFTEEDPSAEPIMQTDTTDTRTLTIIVPDSWLTVNIYTWDPMDFGEFPGIVVDQSNGVRMLTVKKSMVNLMIIGLKEKHVPIQTSDITLINNGKNVTVEVREDASFTITYENSPPPRRSEAPTDDEGTPSNYRVVGNADWMGNWQADNDLGIMNEVAPGVYRKTFKDVPPGNYALKITKDGQWDVSYGDFDGQNYMFTVLEQASITVDFTIKDGIGIIDVYGQGVPALSGPDNEEDSTDTRTPTSSSSQPNSNQGSSSNKPSAGDPIATDPSVTEPVDPGTTVPQATQPTEPDPGSSVDPPTDSTPADPGLTQPNQDDPAGSPDDFVPQDPSAPVDGDSSKSDPSALADQPITSLGLFLFGIIAVFAYLLFLIARRKKVSGNITPDGKMRRQAHFSAGAVTRAVKENMPTPSGQLDQKILDAIQNTKQPPSES